jgi:hypothetical protein
MPSDDKSSHCLWQVELKNPAENKCLLFSTKPQKFHTAEMTSYKVNVCKQLMSWVCLSENLFAFWLSPPIS